MSIVDRAKKIILKPADEWNAIAGEPATIGGLFTGYAMILAALPVIAGLIALELLGIGQEEARIIGMSGGLMETLARSLLGYIVGLAMLYVMALIVNAVSPSFNGKSDIVQSLKLMIYASTPIWLIGVLTPFLVTVPLIALPLSLGAVAYFVYLIYLGLRPLLSVPQEKIAGFTVVVVLVYLVIATVISVLILGLMANNLFGAGTMPGA